MIRLSVNIPGTSLVWRSAMEGEVLGGLYEYSDYVIAVEPGSHQQPVRLLVDDVELLADRAGHHSWTAMFFAGRVSVDVVDAEGHASRCWLDVSPSPSKSGDEYFREMVDDIRAFDQRMLWGDSSATMAFGRDGRSGRFTHDVLLARLQRHGNAFLAAMLELSGSPHKTLTQERQPVPLLQVRRLDASNHADRRLIVLASRRAQPNYLFTRRVHTRTSGPTFDTQTNRALLSLLRRFGSVVREVQHAVQSLQLAGLRIEQQQRAPRRLEQLADLASGLAEVLAREPFVSVERSETTASGLAQIAAHPRYSRPYRLGSQAMMTGIEGAGDTDDLHVNQSWGIYETWCLVEVLKIVGHCAGAPLTASQPLATAAEMAFSATMNDGSRLELLFQSTFSSRPHNEQGVRAGRSISGERRPDLVLVHTQGPMTRAMIMDAKWRSGRSNVLDAMTSVHIYHDARRISAATPEPCLLLLPSLTECPDLERDDFIAQHGVGAVANFSAGRLGREALRGHIANWLAC